MPLSELSAVDFDNAHTLGKKSKKKVKKQRLQVEDADDTPYARSMTPSPPTYVKTTKRKEVLVEAHPPEKSLLDESPERHSPQHVEVPSQEDPLEVPSRARSQTTLVTPSDEFEDEPDPQHHGDFSDDTTAFEDQALPRTAREAAKLLDTQIDEEPLPQVSRTAATKPLKLQSGLANERSARPKSVQEDAPLNKPVESLPPMDAAVARPRGMSAISPPSQDESAITPLIRPPPSTHSRTTKVNRPVTPPNDARLPARSKISEASPPRRLDIGRRLSSYPQRKSSLFDAPPPHLPQAHFYAPEVQDTSRTVRFDTFLNAGDHAAATRASDVLLVGMDGALDVYRVLPDKMEIIARLEGLPGPVLDAKVLPVVGSDALAALRPLVAIVVGGNPQTVGVYSLRTQEHIRTLYQSLPGMEPGLNVNANGSFVTISGSSGEVFVFKDFSCVGKFWTTLCDTRPLLSLGRRWLVISCPDSSSMVSIGGEMPLSTTAYGVSSHNAPLQPPITTDVHGLSQEGLVSRVTRQAAQEVLKASRKGVELGWAGWTEFVQPTPRHVRADSGEFPPTHATEILKRVDPAVVSIIDLERMSHWATFALDDGCSFLSLSTDGLKLVTTSRTGEASYIWDLTHAAHTTEDGPHLRCIQRISRNSPATVVSAAWSLSDDSLAMQTAHGTIHLHNICEQRKTSKPIAISPSPPSAGYWQRFTDLNTLADTAIAARAAGGRMLAKGLATGYTLAKTGVQDAWHADDNKIRLDGVSHRWLRHGLAVALNDKVYLHSVVRETRDKVTLKVEKGIKQFALPLNGAADCPVEPHGFWALRSLPRAVVVAEQDEFETNPSYCPFHVDRRVTLLSYEPREMLCFGETLGSTYIVNKEVDVLDQRSVVRLGGVL